MTNWRALARAGIIVTAAFFASRVLGWVRLLVLGTTFGASRDLDAFFAAFRIPDLIFQLVAAGAIGTALIPVLAGLFASDERARAWRVVSTVANLMLLALAVLATVVFVAAPAIMPAVTPGFDASQLERTVGLTRTMLLSPIFLALGSVANSVLNAQQEFVWSALAPIVYNLAIIGAALFLAPSMGVEGLAVGVVAGSVLHVAIQLRPLSARGFRYRARIDLKDSAARQALALMGPRALGLGVSQLTLIVATSLASGLETGSISAFNIAFTILQIPIGVLGVPLGIVALPAMATELARGSYRQFTRLLSGALRLMVFAMLPLTALGIVLRRQVITLLFDYGRFDARAVDLTADALFYFLLALASEALIVVLARAFYAGRDTLTPVLAALVAVGVNITVAILVVGRLGLPGLAFALAAASWVEVTILLIILWQRVPGLDVRGLGRTLLTVGIASALAGAACLAVTRALDGILGETLTKPELALQVVLAGGAGTVAFLGACLALRIPELPTILGLMRDALRRPGGS